MVLANALCAVNLAASAMVNGICCCYQMNEEDKRRTQHERILTNVVRKELEFSAKQKANLLVKAYYSNERRRNPKATIRKPAASISSSNSTSSSIIDKRRTNASTTGTTNGYSCCYPRDPAPPPPLGVTAELEFESPESAESEQYFYPIEIGIATKSRTSNSLSSVATKKSDNRFKLKDELPELFVRLVSSSRQSLVDAYDKRKQENNTNTTKNNTNTNDNDNNSSYSSMPLLAPIRPVFSLLDSDDDANDDYDDDHYNKLLHRGNNDNGDFEKIRIE